MLIDWGMSQQCNSNISKHVVGGYGHLSLCSIDKVLTVGSGRWWPEHKVLQAGLLGLTFWSAGVAACAWDVAGILQTQTENTYKTVWSLPIVYSCDSTT